MSEPKKSSGKISRRKFLIRGGLGTAGVLAVGTYLLRNPIRREILAYANKMEMPYMGETDNPLFWFELTNDNRIRLHSPKVEMGQGIFTGMVQLAAEELGISTDRLDVVHAATATGNIDRMSTGGSTSISLLWTPLRELAATFREMLRAEAARKLGTDARDIRITDTGFATAGRQISFTDTARDVAKWDIPDTPELKPTESFTCIGRPLPRVDLEPKVFGSPMFGLDAELPGMLYAAVLRSSHIGARLTGADTSEAAGMPGVVRIVEETDFVGVVARSHIEAHRAKEAIIAEWETPQTLQQADIENMITVGNGKSMVIQKAGDALEDDDVITMEFRSPIGAHAQIEPNGALAHVTDEGATVLISTQVVSITRDEVAERLEMEPEQVNVIPTYLGGGFGRRLHTPHAVQAAVMSRAVGRPVKYIFSREEEFRHDMFRPPTHHILKARLAADGSLEGLEHHFVSGDVANDSALIPDPVPAIIGADVGAIRGGFLQYSGVRDLRSVYWHVDLPFATSWWRGLGLLANTFAIESFMDHLAAQARQDAVHFRLRHIRDDAMGTRLKAVIRRAAEAAGYHESAMDGRAMGIAASVDAGTPCAHIAEVSVEDDRIRVHRVICVLDPGLAVNPDQVIAQCEGCIHMGLSAALFEEMRLEDGMLTPAMYGPYRMALMRDAPREVRVELLQGMDSPSAVGEPPIGPIGAAIANAVFRVSGQRLTRMPLVPEMRRGRAVAGDAG